MTHLRVLSTRTVAIVCGGMTLFAAQSAEVGSLRRAELRVRFESPVACHVTADFEIEAAKATDITHRLVTPEGVGVDDVSVSGEAGLAAAPSVVGQTRVLIASLSHGRAGRHTYRVTYALRLEGDARGFTCPIWLPDSPTSGSGRPVSLSVELPADAAPLPDSFPGLAWSSREGTTTLANMPAFVRVPFSTPAVPASWLERIGLRRLTDVGVITLVVGASAWRLLTLRRRRTIGV